MLIVREVMYCKPGKVRDLVNKFKAMQPIVQKLGFKPMRISTDVVAEQFWMCILESEIESIDDFSEMEKQLMNNDEIKKGLAGYHDLVERGRREIYRVET